MEEDNCPKCIECNHYNPAEDMCDIHYWVNPFEKACALFIPYTL